MADNTTIEKSYIEVNDTNFDAEVLKSQLPVIIDFWAAWCGPCKMFGPIFEKVAAEYKGKVVFAKVNVDESQDVSQTCKIRSIPTIMLYKSGSAVATKVGALSESDLKAFIDGHL